jgi:D-psicose/D-tagatose/L-ribulose 3-epimerase
MPVTFGANLWIWDSPVTFDVIRRHAPILASWGFDVIEIPFESIECWNPQQVRSVLDSAGLQASVCIAMSSRRDLTTGNPATVQATQDYLRGAIEAAAVVGSLAIGGPIYSPTGQTGVITADERRAILARLGENLQPVLDDARQANVKLALEPINRFETSLFNTVDQALAFIDLVNDPFLGLLLDTFHMNIEERDISSAIRAAGSHLVHVHACGNDRGAPGDGSIPWRGIAAALDDVEYSGPLVIESFAGGNEMMAAAAAIWRPLAASQDDIATNGLAFLQEVFLNQ